MAILAGASGLIAFIWIACRHFGAITRDGSLKPFALMALYAVLTAAMAAAGRVQHSSAQALSSRYLVFSMLFWIGLLVMLAGRPAGERANGSSRRSSLAPLMTYAGALAITLGAALTSFDSRIAFLAWYRHLTPARESLIAGRDDAFLGRLYPNREILLERRLILERRRLSVFRDRPPR